MTNFKNQELYKTYKKKLQKSKNGMESIESLSSIIADIAKNTKKRCTVRNRPTAFAEGDTTCYSCGGCGQNKIKPFSCK